MHCGVDIVYIPEFARKIERAPQLLQQLFDISEQHELYSVVSLASNFAAKEAVMKALNRQITAWHAIRVYRTDSGAPVVQLCDERFKQLDIQLSLSHDNDYAIAFVVIAD